MDNYSLQRQKEWLNSSRRNANISFTFAVVSAILIIVSISIRACEPAQVPALSPAQNIQEIQCISSNGDLATYHINIPSIITNKASFIEGFCNSLR